MNITIWSNDRNKAVERLNLAYGDVVIVEESPIFGKNGNIVGFRFIVEPQK